MSPSNLLIQLLTPSVGLRRGRILLDTLAVPADLERGPSQRVSRAQLSMALALVLFDDVSERVPLARAHAREVAARGGRLVFDHGALRTVAGPSGELPPGSEAFRRILEPLGFLCAGIYPLDRIGMTGLAFSHVDLPEAIPQYFVSELHPERFSPEFQAAAERVLATGRDPLPASAHGLLDELERTGSLSFTDARELLPLLASCFDRHHEDPRLEDYGTLLAESEEMAWIATEGNAFNHATDRVEDVEAVAAEQRRRGRPIKERVEVSASGRVRQTAFTASFVERAFRDENDELVLRPVPGSFHEFISRDRLPDGSLDLTFDAGNAQSIFKMTSARPA